MDKYNLEDFVNATVLGAYWEEYNRNVGDPYVGSVLFPSRRSNNTNMSMMKGTKGLPVVLQPSTYDTKAPLRDKIGFSRIEYGMPFFREAAQIGEKERQELVRMLAYGDESVKTFIPYIYDQLTPLLDGAETAMERMRMEALANGSFLVRASSETGRSIEYSMNYDVDGSWTTNNKFELTGTDTWTAANASTNDPIGDLITIKDQIMDYNGGNPTQVLLTSATLRNMLQSESIKKMINPLYFDSMRFSRLDLQRQVEEEAGLTFITYDKMFVDEENNTKKFYPDNQITLLPGGAVGASVYGVTPEELDLITSNNHRAAVSVVNPGITITSWREEHPVNISTVVSAVMMPSFENIDDVFVVKVA